MATANDSVYVKFIADTSDFTSKMKQAISPITQFTRVLHQIMTFGGVAIILRQIAQQVGEMEKAYVKLHPESQKAVGSLSSWNAVMENMKAEGGGIVAGVLTPIREAFINMIDPVHAATWELTLLQKELQKIAEKYLTTERKTYQDRNTLLEDQNKAHVALIRETNTLGYYYNRLKEAQKAVNDDVAGALKEQRPQQIELQKILANAQVVYNEHLETWQAASIAYRNATEKLAELDAQVKTTNDEALKKQREELEKAAAAAKAYADMLAGLLKFEMDIAQVMKEANGGFGNEPWDRGVPQKGGKGGRVTNPIGRPSGGKEDFTQWINIYVQKLIEIQKLNDEITQQVEVDWSGAFENIARAVTDIAYTMGAAFASGDILSGLNAVAQKLMSMFSMMALEAAFGAARDGLWPLALGFLAIAGITSFAGGLASGVNTSRSGVELPRMAAGGVVTRPTLALIGESGPEAVVPLGHGAGGVTVNVYGNVWQTEDLARAVAGAMGRW